MPDARTERIGRNEAVFRELNERIEQVAEAFDFGSDPLELVCECGNPNCTQRITLSPGEYETLRSDLLQFAVASGHEAPTVEEVVEHRNGYDVVRKRPGEPTAVAVEAERRKP